MPVRKSHQAPQQSTRVSEFKVQGVQLSNLKGTKPSSTTAEHGQAQVPRNSLESAPHSSCNVYADLNTFAIMQNLRLRLKTMAAKHSGLI
eukprot:scaffold137862_cov18-Tisochrysis_lutea.AAC.1